MNRLTFSMGDLCTKIMRQLPNVTAIGFTNGGCGVEENSDPANSVTKFFYIAVK